MTEHKIHDRLPSGFSYANERQAEAFAATGSVSGASKVCLVRRAATEREITDKALELQGQGPDEFPFGYYEHLAGLYFEEIPPTYLAIRLRPPRTMSAVRSIGRRSTDDVAEYVRLYNAGWAAGGRRGDSDAFASGGTPHAWDDGYLDRSAERAKWHLTWCLDHDECGEG